MCLWYAISSWTEKNRTNDSYQYWGHLSKVGPARVKTTPQQNHTFTEQMMVGFERNKGLRGGFKSTEWLLTQKLQRHNPVPFSTVQNSAKNSFLC